MEICYSGGNIWLLAICLMLQELPLILHNKLQIGHHDTFITGLKLLMKHLWGKDKLHICQVYYLGIQMDSITK